MTRDEITEMLVNCLTWSLCDRYRIDKKDLASALEDARKALLHQGHAVMPRVPNEAMQAAADTVAAATDPASVWTPMFDATQE